MARVAQRELHAFLGAVAEGASSEGPLPFSDPFLERLRGLVGADWVECWEMRLDGCELLDSVTLPDDYPHPDRDEELWVLSRCEYPLRDVVHRDDTRVLKLSDLVSWRYWRNTGLYALYRPLPLRDEMKAWLPAPAGVVRSLGFLRRRRPFGDRERGLVELIRPTLALMSEHFDLRHAPAPVEGLGLTDREAEILAWVARGKTNQEIASALVLSPHTVRKHLEHAYDKLGVHTRTAAVARAFTHAG